MFKSLYSNINTDNEEIRESGRLLFPPERVETFALTSDVGDMGLIGEPIVFANPEFIAVCRLNPDANNWDITGLKSPGPGEPFRRMIIQNISDLYAIRLRNNNGGSLAENRFLFKQPIQIIEPGEAMILMYDNDDLRWRPISIF